MRCVYVYMVPHASAQLFWSRNDDGDPSYQHAPSNRRYHFGVMANHVANIVVSRARDHVRRFHIASLRHTRFSTLATVFSYHGLSWAFHGFIPLSAHYYSFGPSPSFSGDGHPRMGTRSFGLGFSHHMSCLSSPFGPYQCSYTQFFTAGADAGEQWTHDTECAASPGSSRARTPTRLDPSLQ